MFDFLQYIVILIVKFNLFKFVKKCWFFFWLDPIFYYQTFEFAQQPIIDKTVNPQIGINLKYHLTHIQNGEFSMRSEDNLSK